MRCPWSLALVLCAAAFAQLPQQEQTETTTKDEAVTFKTRVNLVMVPVVVHDKQGKPIGALKQDDFQLFDRGKPQLITRFSLEGAAGAGKAGGKGAKPAPGADAPPVMPDRYVAYLFDDIHTAFADLVHSRDAAWDHMQTGLRPADRAAVFTTSGQNAIDFTDDRDALHAALMQLRPRPINMQSASDCPEVNYYQGDLIQNKNDPLALSDAIAQTMLCAHLDSTTRTAAESIARAAASRAVSFGAQETRVSFAVLRDVLRRMAATPGQRAIILSSPGFLTPEFEQDKSEVIDRAIRANVVINSLDARGLWTDPSLDATRPGAATRYIRDEAMADEDILVELASGTGGKFFHNSNDLAGGFRQLGEISEYVYLLGFSPQNLKLDGTYHALKVVLRGSAGLVASARRGYYAPKRLADPVETAKEEIREAIFSREETREIPVDLQTQFFKPSNESARVTVAARVDLKALKYRKDDERHRNQFTVTYALFDRNGNWVAGLQKNVELRLKDDTLARPDLGIVVRGTMDVKPGAYLIRVVVRDSEGQNLTALNGATEIP